MEEIAEDHPQWKAYAAGYATTVLNVLDDTGLLDETQLRWLSQFEGSAREICNRLIDAYTVDEITKKLTA
jgi:hypothetical protein